MNWRDNLINDNAGIQDLLSETQTIAVLGIKTEAQSESTRLLCSPVHALGRIQDHPRACVLP